MNMGIHQPGYQDVVRQIHGRIRGETLLRLGRGQARHDSRVVHRDRMMAQGLQSGSTRTTQRGLSSRSIFAAFVGLAPGRTRTRRGSLFCRLRTYSAAPSIATTTRWRAAVSSMDHPHSSVSMRLRAGRDFKRGAERPITKQHLLSVRASPTATCADGFAPIFGHAVATVTANIQSVAVRLGASAHAKIACFSFRARRFQELHDPVRQRDPANQSRGGDATPISTTQ